MAELVVHTKHKKEEYALYNAMQKGKKSKQLTKKEKNAFIKKLKSSK